MRTKHNYLSLKQHETDAAVKPEVFMASTHVLMPFGAEVFVDGYIIQTYLSQFWCLFWNAKYCSDAYFEMLIFMDTCYHVYTWGLLFLFVREHFWQMMIWEINWPQCSPREIEIYTSCSPREIERSIREYKLKQIDL